MLERVQGRFDELFAAHPASVDETYGEHLQVAWGFAQHLLLASLQCFIHGLLPFLFCRSASQRIELLHQRMVQHRHVKLSASGESATSAPAPETAR